MSGHPTTDPYGQPSPLVAPRPQAPPSTIPSQRLATQAEHWLGGQVTSPGPYPPQQYGAPSPRMDDYRSPSRGQTAPPPAQHQQQASQPQPLHGWSVNSSPFLGASPQFASGGQMPGQQRPMQPFASAGAAPPPPSSYMPSIAPGERFVQAGPPPIAPQYQQRYAPPPSQHSQTYSSYPSPPQPPIPQFQQQQPNSPYAGSHSPAPQVMLQQQQQQQYQQQQQQQRPPPRVASAMDSYALPALQSLSLGPPPPSGRRSLYATPEDGPPYKLSVVHPDHKMLESMRQTASGPNGDVISKKVAWAKQVLKFIERHQSTAGESSRINDPTLVRWTDEALNHILTSASSSSPVPLALFLRGELSSSGSFPSYRAKDPKSAFRDFEAAANAGYEKAWFRIGRAYEEFGDVRRAVGAYEKGVEKGDCGSTYRLAMAYLLGQIGVVMDVKKSIGLLQRAADTADLDTPQPPYILGMLLSGEFESPAVQLPKDIVPLNIEEAKWRIERAAYLSFGPAQYKMGFSYEYAALGCIFDPLLSVQYYALASQNGEVEADMALSKWYLCGSEGNFDKNEELAVTFAEKAASRSLPSAEFALGYYREVGINGTKDLEQAKRWYARAAGHGNVDARDRLEALAASEQNVLSRMDHESHVDTKLVRKRTQAQARSDEQIDRYEAESLAASLSGRGQHQAYGQNDGYRPQTDPGSKLLRRRDTLQQVEAAVSMNGGRKAAGAAPGSARPQDAGPGNARPQGAGQQGRTTYQLTDGPSPSGTRPIVQAETPMRKKPETFAEMGIATQKAKADECIVM